MPKMYDKKGGGNSKAMQETYAIDSGYHGSGSSGRTAKDGESQSGSEIKTQPKVNAGKSRADQNSDE